MKKMKWRTLLTLTSLTLMIGCGAGSQELVPVQIGSRGLPELVYQEGLRDGRLASSVVRIAYVDFGDGFFADYAAAYVGGGLFIPGTYMGIAFGNMGRTQVAITFDEDRIESIEQIAPEAGEEVTDQFALAYTILSEQLIELQTMDLDIVSGATLSSISIIYSFNDALRHALREVLVVERQDTSIVGNNRFIPGVYSAAAPGRNADVEVTLWLSDTTIYAVTISHRETPEHAHANIEQLADNILSMQGDVDIISGSTRSSVAIIASIESILNQARVQ